MDPNAVLQQLERLIERCEGYTSDKDDLCACLATWIMRGGFSPDWDKAPRARDYFVEWNHFQ